MLVNNRRYVNAGVGLVSDVADDYLCRHRLDKSTQICSVKSVISI